MALLIINSNQNFRLSKMGMPKLENEIYVTLYTKLTHRFRSLQSKNILGSQRNMKRLEYRFDQA